MGGFTLFPPHFGPVLPPDLPRLVERTTLNRVVVGSTPTLGGTVLPKRLILVVFSDILGVGSCLDATEAFYQVLGLRNCCYSLFD